MFYSTNMDIIDEQSTENFWHSAGEYESLQSIETNFQEPVNELIKSLSWISTDQVQTYDGRVLNSNLHGDGRYVWRNQVPGPLGESFVSAVYEGTFYASAKEGYGLLSHKDCSTFEGLFKAGKPFGPGVFTQSDGRQDVGIWRGSRLYRIYAAVDGVPKLAESSAAKIKLMKYRRLVPSTEEDCKGVLKDFAKLVLTQLGASETLANDLYPKLFNPDARSTKSLFFDQESHEKAYFKTPKSAADDDQDATLDGADVASSLSDRASGSTEATPYLVAWNNEPFMLDVLSHVYRNRPFEADVSFCVGTLVTGQRRRWRARGDHEEVAFSYLTAVADGAKEQVQRIVTFFAVDENVSDARGNNAVHLAAAGDRHELLAYVVRAGANVNQQNDEGMTPLTLSLTRYASVSRRSARWELAFLPPPSEFFATPPPPTSSSSSERHQDPVEWHVRRSKTSIVSWDDDLDDDAIAEIFEAQLAKAGGKLTADMVVPERKYLLSLRPLMVLPEQKVDGEKKKKGKAKKDEMETLSGERKEKKGKKDKGNVTEDKKSKKKGKSEKTEVETMQEAAKTKKMSFMDSEAELPPEEDVDPSALTADELDQLAEIETTIDVLLDLGADPNVGQTPSSPLVLALCAGNVALAEKLLRHGASPRAANLAHGFGLTPLHVVCLLRPRAESAELARLLAAFGADPHAAADVAYDAAARRTLLTGLDDGVVEGARGMTPLHALALRPDYRHSAETVTWLRALIGAVVEASGEPVCRHGYLGHSPLSLAAFRGDLDVVGELLALGALDPSATLGGDLGNVLAVLAAWRCFELVPVAARVKLCDLLVAHGADPLRRITLDGGDFCGNVVDFCSNEVRKEIDKQPNPKKLPKELTMRLKEYKKLTSVLLERAKERLVLGVLGRLTVALADAAREALNGSASRQLANLLTEWELVRGLVLLCEARQIAPTRAEAALMIAAVLDADQARAQFAGPTADEMLEYVAPFLRADDDDDDDADDEGDVVARTLPAFSRRVGPFATPPELDVAACVPTACFECGRTHAELETCARCGLVAFCSKACNKANLARGGRFMHRCANAFVGVKEAAALPIVWGQLWKAKGKKDKGKKDKGKKDKGKKDKGKKEKGKKDKEQKKGKKDKEQKKGKRVKPVANPKNEFFQSLDFNDGRNYDEVLEENAVLPGIGDEVEAFATEQGEEPDLEKCDDWRTETTATTSDDAKTAEGKDASVDFSDSAGSRCNSRKRWKDAINCAQVTKNLFKVSLRLSRHSNLAEQPESRSEPNALGRRLFPCSDETIGSPRLALDKELGPVLGRYPRARVSVDQTIRLARGASLFEEASNALGMLDAPMEEAACEAAPSGNRRTKKSTTVGAEQKDKIASPQADQSDQTATESTARKPKRGNVIKPRCAGKKMREAVIVVPMKWEAPSQEWDGKRRLVVVRRDDTDEFFPAQAICALLKIGVRQGDATVSPDLFLLPYTVYKDGDLYYCAKEPNPSSRDNASLV